MTNLVTEMIGRYVVSGLIMYAILYIGLITRISVLMIRGTKSMSEVAIRGRRLSAFPEKVKSASRWMMAVRYIVWPYGIVKIMNNYVKIEPRLIRMMNEGRF